MSNTSFFFVKKNTFKSIFYTIVAITTDNITSTVL